MAAAAAEDGSEEKLDLHGLTTVEAEAGVVHLWRVRGLGLCTPGGGRLHLIAGAGNHSGPRGPRLRPAVQRLLDGWRVQYVAMTGAFSVACTGPRPFTGWKSKWQLPRRAAGAHHRTVSSKERATVRNKKRLASPCALRIRQSSCELKPSFRRACCSAPSGRDRRDAKRAVHLTAAEKRVAARNGVHRPRRQRRQRQRHRWCDLPSIPFPFPTPPARPHRLMGTRALPSTLMKSITRGRKAASSPFYDQDVQAEAVLPARVLQRQLALWSVAAAPAANALPRGSWRSGSWLLTLEVGGAAATLGVTTPRGVRRRWETTTAVIQRAQVGDGGRTPLGYGRRLIRRPPRPRVTNATAAYTLAVLPGLPAPLAMLLRRQSEGRPRQPAQPLCYARW